MPKYLSPTSLALWYSNRNQFYMNYLCETRTPRDPQTAPMAVGSAFDAYVKSWLVERLLGPDPAFQRDTLFEAQVEPQNRDEARRAGQEVFDAYTKQGALADLLLDLEGCVGRPRFETGIEAPVSMSGLLGDVPMLGKPDIFFMTKKGARITFDWKVNGYYGKRNTSPKPGYVRQRTNGKGNGQCHDQAMIMDKDGVRIAVNFPLCNVDKSWAAQLSIYSWLLGEPIGAQFIVAIDQIAVGFDAFGGREFRIAQHRSVVSESFQRQTFENAHKAWACIQSGHVFDQMSRADSDKHCRILDDMAATPRDPDFDSLMR